MNSKVIGIVVFVVALGAVNLLSYLFDWNFWLY